MSKLHQFCQSVCVSVYVYVLWLLFLSAFFFHRRDNKQKIVIDISTVLYKLHTLNLRRNAKSVSVYKDIKAHTKRINNKSNNNNRKKEENK